MFDHTKDFLWDSKFYDEKLGDLRKEFMNLRGSKFWQERQAWAQTFEQFKNGVLTADVTRSLTLLRGEVVRLGASAQATVRELEALKMRSQELTELRTLSVDCSFAIRTIEQIETAFVAYDKELGLAVDACRNRSFDDTLSHLTQASLQLSRVRAGMQELQRSLHQPLADAMRNNIRAPVSGPFAKVA